MLKYHAPPGVVVNSAMDVVQFRGRTSPFLEQSTGKPSVNLLKLARNGLAVELRTLIGAARKNGAPVYKYGVRFSSNNQTRILDLSVTPLGENAVRERGTREKGQLQDSLFLVLFHDVSPHETPDAKGGSSSNKAKASESNRLLQRETERLKQEVARTQDALRSAIDSEDALKEQFQSANEEILSANEELQSTNEELETSKEELQSANEELNTLNAELRHKNSELQELSNDISNVLNSTRIPLVMLDRGLRIRRLTPTADMLLKALPSDIGRPLSDIRPNIEAPELEQWIAKVLESLQPMEREVQDLQGHWRSLNILPYRTQDNKIDGVVLALQDIDVIKAASEQLSKSLGFFRSVLDTVRGPLLVLDRELRVLSANRPFLITFQVSPEKTLNRFIYDLGNGQWNIPKLRNLLERVLSNKEPITDYEMHHDFESIGRRTMLLNARVISSENDAQPMLLLAIDDITERRQAEATLRESEQRYRELLNALPVAVYTTDAEGRITLFSEAAAAFAGRRAQTGKDRWCITHRLYRPDGSVLPQEESPMAVTLRTGEPQRGVEAIAERPDGTRAWFVPHPTVLRDGSGAITGGINVLVDITARKRAEAALVKSEKLAAAGRLAAVLAHEINNPLQAVTNLMSLLEQAQELKLSTRTYATMAAEELGRITHLTRQSLGFYRESTSPAAVNIQETLDSVLDLYSKQLEKRGILVRKRYRSSKTINSYAGEIRQIFTTLLVNAMEATPKGGIIDIHIRAVGAGDNSTAEGVRVAIADTGVGISKANYSRIFEPFFTTKGQQGTGLGLWVTQGVVNRLGGVIRVRSSVRPEKSGTCFSIFLPSELLLGNPHTSPFAFSK